MERFVFVPSTLNYEDFMVAISRDSVICCHATPSPYYLINFPTSGGIMCCLLLVTLSLPPTKNNIFVEIVMKTRRISREN